MSDCTCNSLQSLSRQRSFLPVLLVGENNSPTKRLLSSRCAPPATQAIAQTASRSAAPTSRRHAIALILPSALVLAAPGAEAVEKAVIYVGPNGPCSSIDAALQTAQEGATIIVAPGLYKERLNLGRPVSIEAAQSCSIRGLTLRHSSPSVANNYAVYNQGGQLRLSSCDISSATGSGIASEGGKLEIEKSIIHDCRSQGIAVYADILGVGGEARIAGSQIVRNRRNGILIREDSRIQLFDSLVANNSEYGLLIKGGDADVQETTFTANGKGAKSL